MSVISLICFATGLPNLSGYSVFVAQAEISSLPACHLLDHSGNFPATTLINFEKPPADLSLLLISSRLVFVSFYQLLFLRDTSFIDSISVQWEFHLTIPFLENRMPLLTWY